ncbi:MAG: hypothetical protein KatS3mg027_1171 [Bacteroidia bacterium]|nr:MAG: hypothetical protein KatS3mg027_1171 [Bacteroidia bacterium]
MKRSFLYISIVFISLIVASIIVVMKQLYQRTIVENKVLLLLPDNPELVISFKNPDELLNHYLSQNVLLKKNVHPDVLKFVDVIQKIDTIYNKLTQNNIHLQDYSFYLAFYEQEKWAIGFAAEKVKDAKEIQDFFQSLNLDFIEIEGNYLFFEKTMKNKLKQERTTLNLWREWMQIFSKKPSPLHIYQRKDSVELAFQVYFDLQDIKCNGFVKYKKTNNYQNFSSFEISGKSEEFKNFLILPLNIVLSNNTIDANSELLNELIQKYHRKKIQLDDMAMIPISGDNERLEEYLQLVSDSAYQLDALKVFELNKSSAIYFSEIFLSKPDSQLYVGLNEYNFVLFHRKELLNNQNNWIQHDFSQSSYFYIHQSDLDFNRINQSECWKFLPISFQFARDTMRYYLNANIHSSLDKRFLAFNMSIGKVASNSQILWTFNNDYTIQNIVGLFDDHKTNNYLVLVQDSTNQLLCLNINGELLWKYTLESPVKSNIFNVDILKNNKHQIIFNTEHKIYLIDRNGKNVGNFPLKFTSAISSSIQVFDYDKNRNYRIWFSTQNRYIYNYTLDGKMANNFHPYYCNDVIAQPLYYASIGLSDYIFVITQKGTIIGISRKGEGRLQLKNHLPNSTIHYVYDVSSTLGNSYLYYCTNTHLSRISLNDEEKDIFQWNKKIIDAKFFFNIFSNKTHLAVLDSTFLSIVNLKGEELSGVHLSDNYFNFIVDTTRSGNYFILQNAGNKYCIIKQDENGELKIIDENVASTIFPRVFSLQKTYQNFLIYSQSNTLYCRKIE